MTFLNFLNLCFLIYLFFSKRVDLLTKYWRHKLLEQYYNTAQLWKIQNLNNGGLAKFWFFVIFGNTVIVVDLLFTAQYGTTVAQFGTTTKIVIFEKWGANFTHICAYRHRILNLNFFRLPHPNLLLWVFAIQLKNFSNKICLKFNFEPII